MIEIWKKIPGFSRYEASSLGQIRSTNYKRTGKTKTLNPSISKDGYLRTMLLNDEGKYKSGGVHTWVALTVIGGRPEGKEVNHIDGVKTHNAISNLEYCTRSENCKHAIKLGLWEIKHGSKNGNSKLTEQDVLAIREYAKKNGPRYGRRALAEKYGISDSHIKDVISGRRGTWKYV